MLIVEVLSKTYLGYRWCPILMKVCLVASLPMIEQTLVLFSCRSF